MSDAGPETTRPSVTDRLPQGAALAALTATTMFSGIVVLLFAWLTVSIESWIDPCVNGGCGALVTSVFIGAAVAEVAVFGLAARFAFGANRSLISRLGVLVAAALLAPVITGVGSWAAVALA